MLEAGHHGQVLLMLFRTLMRQITNTCAGYCGVNLMRREVKV